MGAEETCAYSEAFSADGGAAMTRCWDTCPRFVFEKTCVEACPDGTVLQLSECVARCEPGWFLSAGHCVGECPGLTYDRRTRECRPSQLVCALYYVENVTREAFNPADNTTVSITTTRSVCVDVCPTNMTRNGRECVETCPEKKNLIEDGTCVSACASRLRNGQSCVRTCPEELPFELAGECAAQCEKSQVARQVGGRLRCQTSVDGCRFMERDAAGGWRCVESCALVSEKPNEYGLPECVSACPAFRHRISSGSSSNGAVFRCASLCGPAEMLDEASGECVGVCPAGTRADGQECLGKCPGGRVPDENGRCAGLRARVRVWAVSGWVLVGLGAVALICVPIVCLTRSPRSPASQAGYKQNKKRTLKKKSKFRRHGRLHAQEMAPTQTTLRSFDDIVRDAREGRSARLHGRGQSRELRAFFEGK